MLGTLRNPKDMAWIGLRRPKAAAAPDPDSLAWLAAIEEGERVAEMADFAMTLVVLCFDAFSCLQAVA